MSSKWQIDPESGRRCRLVRRTPTGPLCLQWDDADGDYSPYLGPGGNSNTTEKKDESSSKVISQPAGRGARNTQYVRSPEERPEPRPGGGYLFPSNPATESGPQIVGGQQHRFSVHRTQFFCIGRVFAIKWAEPSGVQKNEPFVKDRRFVVVQFSTNASWCLPISTYDGQGCMKSGCHAETHAIIHVEGSQVIMKTGELGRGLPKEAIEMKPANPSITLHPMSRINIAKVSTVEHNQPVEDIGVLTGDARKRLVKRWNDFVDAAREREKAAREQAARVQAAREQAAREQAPRPQQRGHHHQDSGIAMILPIRNVGAGTRGAPPSGRGRSSRPRADSGHADDNEESDSDETSDEDRVESEDGGKDGRNNRDDRGGQGHPGSRGGANRRRPAGRYYHR